MLICLRVYVKYFLHENNRHFAVIKNNVKSFRLRMEHTLMEEAGLSETFVNNPRQCEVHEPL